MRVIFPRRGLDFRTMRAYLIALLGVGCFALTPSLTFASGSTAPPETANNRAMDRASSGKTGTIANSATQTEVAEEPYNLGKALYSGKYKFGQPKLSAANVAEKTQRLRTLQSTLPAAERGKVKLTELSQRLTDREVNALEYYVGMRFGKFITTPPSWAKVEPPPKIVLPK